jgi:protein-tyrosine-phosphatase
VVINMSGRAREFAFRNFSGYAKAEDWEIEDPYGDAEKYQGTYEAIRRRVMQLAQRIRKESATRDGREDDADSGARP